MDTKSGSHLPTFARRHLWVPLVAAVMIAVALAITVALMKPASAEHSSAESRPSGESTVWQSMLIVVEAEDSGITYTGCRNGGTGRGVGDTRCSGGYSDWLGEPSFKLAGEWYTFTTIATNSDGDLTVTLDKQIPSRHIAAMSMEVNPYIEPEGSMMQGFVAGYTAPDANRLEASNATVRNLPDGSQSMIWSASVTDWKIATRAENAWGHVTMRLVYDDDLPETSEPKCTNCDTGSDEGRAKRSDTSTSESKDPDPTPKPDPQVIEIVPEEEPKPEPHESVEDVREEGDAQTQADLLEVQPEPTATPEPAPEPTATPELSPEEQIVADLVGDDGCISQDERANGAAVISRVNIFEIDQAATYRLFHAAYCHHKR